MTIEKDENCTDIEWTRIKSDVNGNSRFVCHFTDLEGFTLRFYNRVNLTLSERYDLVVKAANKLGGKRFHNKQFGAGIVFTSYEFELPKVAKRVREILNSKGKTQC